MTTRTPQQPIDGDALRALQPGDTFYVLDVVERRIFKCTVQPDGEHVRVTRSGEHRVDKDFTIAFASDMVDWHFEMDSPFHATLKSAQAALRTLKDE